MLLLVFPNVIYTAGQREVMLQRMQIFNVREKRMNSKEKPWVVKYELEISIQNQVACISHICLMKVGASQ